MTTLALGEYVEIFDLNGSSPRRVPLHVKDGGSRAWAELSFDPGQDTATVRIPFSPGGQPTFGSLSPSAKTRVDRSGFFEAQLGSLTGMEMAPRPGRRSGGLFPSGITLGLRGRDPDAKPQQILLKIHRRAPRPPWESIDTRYAVWMLGLLATTFLLFSFAAWLGGSTLSSRREVIAGDFMRDTDATECVTVLGSRFGTPLVRTVVANHGDRYEVALPPLDDPKDAAALRDAVQERLVRAGFYRRFEKRKGALDDQAMPHVDVVDASANVGSGLGRSIGSFMKGLAWISLLAGMIFAGLLGKRPVVQWWLN